ncbi:hypothetical protein METHPM2_10020 [Pseudomonas sp. PM2]|uniref:Uncharacterized protein n=2 Tax=Pseudomonas TaxID=286 RepID=A0AAX3IHY8_9PSED|nr:hypothetical protein T1E_4699 [Pseudomonas putida DOT-T1E]AZE70114.1 hypothetical protein C4K01_5967 [Pseudomonas synxantha]EMR46186.1 hypothetical protein PPUTLS46_017204 [Pseudomonas putida LS46]CAD0262826.1 conserved hypothetical protein [Pseudomonas veronii]CAH0185698.1 hypothetical protein SRABI64_01368 [Pseudomonas carnis]SUD47253.1 Uncharacterised protein [Pseudomonas fluorescens]SUD80926.1 Uncharacterised protein [Pseudomonas putida]BBV99780.1 hypothetical protein STW0522PSE72_513
MVAKTFDSDMSNISEGCFYQLVPGTISLNTMDKHERDGLSIIFDIRNLHID